MLKALSALLAAALLAPRLLAAAPLAAASKAPSARNGAAGCQIVDIGSSPARRNSFSATRIIALEFEARLQRHVSREHSLRLRIYTPSGFLYQVLEVPRSPSWGWNDRGSNRLMARLPVAGTSIMASALYGRWKVVPHLDDQPEPCGPGRSFVIQP